MLKKWLTNSALGIALAMGQVALALDVPLVPLVTNATSQTPLNLLVVGKDHKLFYEAYDDASDLDGDGVVDIRYRPTKIDYYGYFDSYKCYAYNSAGLFEPKSVTANKKCSDQWSGDFLNYLTTSRIDALRRVLYGGLRSTDDAKSDTYANGRVILQRAYIPQDAHSWGKQYTNVTTDGYNLADYAPKAWVPASGKRVLFASVTIGDTAQMPLLRAVIVSDTINIWNWVSKETPVAGDVYSDASGATKTFSPTNYTVRVRVCDSSVGLESNCKKYSDGSIRPYGLLQKYGDTGRMRFGLLTGSYDLPLDGGVLRKNIGDITDEIDSASGRFISSTGIVKSLNSLRVDGFSSSSRQYSCGWETSNNLANIAKCRNWGSPLAEMIYESLRYYGGLAKTDAYTSSTTYDSALGLPTGISWVNPYGTDTSTNKPRNYWCAQPNITIINNGYTSYDTGIPGSSFGAESRAALGSFSAKTVGDALWQWEFGGEKNIAIGEVYGATNDLAPTIKKASSFDTIRGQTPGEPTRQGGYGTAALAYFARSNTIVNPSVKPTDLTKLPKINTYAVSLSPPTLKVSITVGNKTVTVQPFAKSVGGSNIPSNSYYPTDQIVDYYVTQVANTDSSNYDASVNGGRPYYKFAINFEDVEQGADHDMDAISEYTVSLTEAGKVRVAVNSTYAAGGIDQHMGYIITGVTPVTNGRSDGLYLVVKDQGGVARNYALDYRDTSNSSCKATTSDLPLTCSLDFSIDTSASTVTQLNDPLWYAAKYGGYTDSTTANTTSAFNQIWDSDGDGVPDNYFLVVNPLKLESQLDKAFESIASRAGSLAGGSGSSMRVLSDSLYYESSFDSKNWTGDLSAYKINVSSGTVDTGTAATLKWSAASQLLSDKASGSVDRIIVAGTDSGGVPFRSTNLSSSGVLSSLRETSETDEANSIKRVDYLRGSAANEGSTSTTFRQRATTKLGDLLRSSPLYVGAPYYMLDSEDAYTTFRAQYLKRDPIVYVGGNDGMLHAFDANTGVERFAFVPKVALQSAVRSDLVDLTKQNYATTHRNFVNGQQTRSEAKLGTVWRSLLAGSLGEGGREIYLLDVTNPATVSETTGTDLVKWEFTNKDDSDLGMTFGKPYIARLNDSKWYVLAPNGYYDKNTFPTTDTAATRKAGLFILPVIKPSAWSNKSGNASGSTYFKLMTSIVGENGLSELRPVDLDSNGTVDLVYAGDLRGNVWKFDISSSDPANWNVALNNQPLFTAKGPDGYIQPITIAPAVAFNTGRKPAVPTATNTGLLVYVGTGKFIEACDKVAGTCGVSDGVRSRESATNSVYGLWDFGGVVCSRGELRQQVIGEYVYGGKTYRTMTQNDVNYPPSGMLNTACTTNGVDRSYLSAVAAPKSDELFPFTSYRLGWFEDLPITGERVITDLTQTSKQLQYLTYIPEVSADGCATTAARSFFMAVSALNGGAFSGSSIVIPSAITAATANSTVGQEVNAAFGYTLFDAPQSSQTYTALSKAYLPFAVGYSEGCANNVKTNAGNTVVLNTGAACTRSVKRVSWREVISN